MVKVKTDMTGWKMWEHGVPDSRLMVIQQVNDYVDNNGNRQAQWLCECSCEEHNQVIVIGSRLRNNKQCTKSCGCLAKELSAKRLQGKYKLNDYHLNLQDEHGFYGVGYCANTKSEFYFDMEDYNKIKNITWYEKVRKNGFRRLAGTDRDTGKQTLMHITLGFKWCDHADKNELNNRKYNLRPATAQENARNHNKQKNNTSGFIGICQHKRYKTWRSYIMIDGKNINLGSYKNKEDAIKARLEAENKYFGKFAPQIHLFEQYGITEQNDCLEDKYRDDSTN